MEKNMGIWKPLSYVGLFWGVILGLGVDSSGFRARGI